ncbi:MAG: YnbE family lipoprotein [Erythrobacter sp.]
MKDTNMTAQRPYRRIGGGRIGLHYLTGMAGPLAAIVMLSGCINIAAPEAPIVIELNINIRQEVVYKLAADAANTIEENEDIF